MAGGVLRKLVWKLTFNVDASETVTAKQAVNGLTGAFEKLTSVATYAMGAMLGVYGAAGLLARNSAKYSEEVDRIATGLDIGVEKFQQYKAAFDALGASTDDITDAFGTLVDRAKDVIEGNKTYAKEFKRVGIAVDELRGKNSGQLFDLFIERSTKVKDRTDAITAAVRLFGDDLGRRLLPVMVENSESLKTLMNMAQRLGLVLDEKTIKAQRRAAIRFRELEFLVSGLARRLGGELVPVFENLANTIISGLNLYALPIRTFFIYVGDRATNEVNKLKKAWEDFVAIFGTEENWAKVADAFERLARALRLMAVGVLLVAAVSGVIIFFQTLGLAGVALAIVLTTLVGVVEDLWVYFHGGVSLLGVLGSKITSLKDDATSLKEALGVLYAAFQALVSEVGALIIELGDGNTEANAFEIGLAALYSVLLVIIRVMAYFAVAVISVVRIFVFMARVVTQVRDTMSEIKWVFDSAAESAGGLVAMIYDLTGALRGLAEINPMTFIPANALRVLQGEEIGYQESMDRITAPLNRVLSSADSGDARRAAALSGAARPSDAAMMAARSRGSGNSNVSVDQRNNVVINLPANLPGGAEAGQLAARTFVEELGQGEALFPGAYFVNP